MKRLCGEELPDDSVVLTVKGTYPALLALERRMIEMVKAEEIKAIFGNLAELQPLVGKACRICRDGERYIVRGGTDE